MTLTMVASSSLSPGLRGALTRWMLEPLPGVFVARLSARVRHELWAEIVDWVEKEGSSYACLIFGSDDEQGFTVQQCGQHSYEAIDLNGLHLISRHARSPQERPSVDEYDPGW